MHLHGETEHSEEIPELAKTCSSKWQRLQLNLQTAAEWIWTHIH